jgi:hypothetical protein
MNARPVLESISPHDGVGGWVPTPRKESDASIRMALPSQIDAMSWARRRLLGKGRAGVQDCRRPFVGDPGDRPKPLD